MLASFAALEQMVNASVRDHLANRIVSAPGVDDFRAVYEDGGAMLAEGFAQGFEPRLEAVPQGLADQLHGQAITLTNPADGSVLHYTVVTVEPAGSGMATLQLRA